jgi:hypothetical protein
VEDTIGGIVVASADETIGGIELERDRLADETIGGIMLCFGLTFM